MAQEDDNKDKDCVIIMDGPEALDSGGTMLGGLTGGRVILLPSQTLERHGQRYKRLWTHPLHAAPAGALAREG